VFKGECYIKHTFNIRCYVDVKPTIVLYRIVVVYTVFNAITSEVTVIK